ncbi:MAG: DUF4329 domain-containing protein [Saccharofermentanales bacterium]
MARKIRKIVIYISISLLLLVSCPNQNPTTADSAENASLSAVITQEGELFNTADEAARDFALRYNALSISEDREYASVIFQVKVKSRSFSYETRRFLWWSWQVRIRKTTRQIRYSYQKIRIGKTHSLLIPFAPLFRKKVAEIHTHGAYNEGYENDEFSPQDTNSFINYLVTPLGTLRKYDPSDGSDIVIYSDIPFDPNHPGR